MLGDIRQAKAIYLVCGYTDMRRGINGLATIVQQNYHMDPCGSGLFLFCGKRRDRIKALLWEPDGFVLLYKRLSNGGYQWPRKAEDVRSLSREEFTWLMQLTNNLAERTVKPFVMARKNFLFCDTAKGADSSALCFSVIETAKRNGLDSFAYLLYLFEELPKLGDQPTEEELQPLLPWANALPKYCRK